jgi:PAS domain S-box-containing protein
MLSKDAGVLNATLRNIAENDAVSRILLVDREGLVKAGTDPDAVGTQIDFSGAGQAQHTGERGRAAVFAAGETFRWVQKIRNRQECHECHQPSQYNGAVIIDFSSTGLKREVTEHIVKEFGLFLGSLAAAGVGMFCLSNFVIIRRLNRVSSAIARYRGEDREVSIDVPGSDEISALGTCFNGMVSAISGSQNELRQHADEMMALTVASHVVSAVPRTEDIFEAICHVAIKELKMKMAWIGVVREGSKYIGPVAQCGFEEGYPSSVEITWDDSPAGGGPKWRAIKTKTPQVTNDMDTNPAFAPWRDEALKRGFRSSMALPLLTSDGDVLGVLNLYAGEPGYFTRKRARMFMIFANQAATAIENRTLLEGLERRSREIVEQFNVISRSQKEWRLTFDSITDLITIHDKEYRIIKANRAAAEYFGVKIEEVVGRKCYELFHGTCSPLPNCPHTTSVAENRVATEEVLDPKNNKIFSVSTFPYYSPEGQFVGSIHVAKDVTEIREKEMRLIMSERLAALGQMSSGIAHEINNPLASIAGCAEGLLMKVRKEQYDPAMFEEYLQIIQEEILRCKSITMGMLSFVRKSTYEKKDVRINDVLDKALDIIGFQGRLKDVMIERRYQKDLPVIRGSEGELRQVFLAIIVNALDAMEDAGTLTFETGSDGDSIFIRTSDTGPGIAPEHMNRIFDPFFTTKSEKGGTGLGLSIAHKIIANHGGTLDASSEEGSGTTFSITLPLPGTR